MMRVLLVSLAGMASACGNAAAQTTVSPEIIVTASPLAGDRDRFATIVDTVTRDQILQHGGASLGDALSQVPGVAGTGFAAGASRPVIRGMDANRVKLLEDGLNSSDVSDIGPDHGVPIDPLSARDIEVVRGAATLRYGSQAIGGVVNAINNRVPMKLPEKPVSGELTGAYGSAANTGEGSLLADGRIGQFALHADGFYRTMDNYETPLGTQANSFFHGLGYSAGGSYFFGDQDKNRIGAGYVHYDTRYGIPSDDTFIDMRQDKAMSKSSFAVNAGALQTINLDLGYANYEHSEIDPAGNVVLSTFKNLEWDSRAEALFGAIGPLTGSALGVQYANRRFSALGEGGDYLFPTQTESAALFAFTEAPLGEKINLQAAARAETVKTDGTPISGLATRRDFTPLSASIGALFTLNDNVKLGLTFTSAARAPGQTELFARGPHDGPGTFETGDPTLKIERANTIEATARLRNGAFKFDGAVWAAKFNNYIFGDLTGRTCDDDGNCLAIDSLALRELFYAQRDANFWGLEGKASADLVSTKAGTFGVHGLFDYVKADFTSAGGPVPRIQPWRLGAGVDWSSEAFDAGAQATYVGKRDKLAAGETPTEGYWEIQAQAAWRPLAAHRNFELALVGRNLTDDVQRNAIALNKDLVVSPGRDIRLVARNAF
jgi:iron complex outermembrane receptor protein